MYIIVEYCILEDNYVFVSSYNHKFFNYKFACVIVYNLTMCDFSCFFNYAKIYIKKPMFFIMFRMLLWDCDDRSYSYYIEVSTDQQHWHMVADKRKEACR